MGELALILIVAGSLLHVGWNSLAKEAEDKLAFLFLALLPAAVVGGVYFAVELARGAVPTTGLACVAGSAAIHALYFWLLSGAYGAADLSYVYPLSRGVGAALSTLGGVALLGDRPAALGWVGIGLALAATFADVPAGRRADRRAFLFTVLTGASIAAYLIVDTVGVAHLSPLVYLGGFSAGTVLLLAPVVRGRLTPELARSGGRFALASLFTVSAYAVVLWAMQLAPVSYVAGARALGIVASALAGVWFFRERPTPRRWLAIALTLAGVTFIALA